MKIPGLSHEVFKDHPITPAVLRNNAVRVYGSHPDDVWRASSASKLVVFRRWSLYTPTANNDDWYAENLLDQIAAEGHTHRFALFSPKFDYHHGQTQFRMLAIAFGESGGYADRPATRADRNEFMWDTHRVDDDDETQWVPLSWTDVEHVAPLMQHAEITPKMFYELRKRAFNTMLMPHFSGMRDRCTNVHSTSSGHAYVRGPVEASMRHADVCLPARLVRLPARLVRNAEERERMHRRLVRLNIDRGNHSVVCRCYDCLTRRLVDDNDDTQYDIIPLPHLDSYVTTP